MTKPLLYDLYCAQGGASVGYHRAGFEVVGIDKDPQPRYPFRFIQMDALEFLRRYLRGQFPRADAFHASPPCQKYSRLAALAKHDYPMLIEPTREYLRATGTPYIIENVEGAPLINRCCYVAKCSACARIGIGCLNQTSNYRFCSTARMGYARIISTANHPVEHTWLLLRVKPVMLVHLLIGAKRWGLTG